MADSNPYLAHWNVGKKPEPSVATKDPLYGFVPRKVTADKVEKALVRPSTVSLGMPLTCV
jgi:hypothetical protein